MAADGRSAKPSRALSESTRRPGSASHEELLLNPDLRHRIESLHLELSAVESVDDDGRRQLLTLLGDITRLLEKSASGEADERGLAERLDELAVHFEAEHPSLGAALRRVVDALGKAGI